MLSTLMRASIQATMATPLAGRPCSPAVVYAQAWTLLLETISSITLTIPIVLPVAQRSANT
jgi:hypothetical protein